MAWNLNNRRLAGRVAMTLLFVGALSAWQAWAVAPADEGETLAVGERLKIGIVGGMTPGEPFWLVRQVEAGGSIHLPGGTTLTVAGLTRPDVELAIAAQFNGGRVVISRLDRGEDHGGGAVRVEAPPLDPELGGLTLVEPLQGTFPFEELLGLIREQTDLSFVVNYSAMELEGIDRNTEVSVDLPAGITLRQTLDLVLGQLSGGFAELGWQADGPLVRLTTLDELSRHTTTVTYDLTRLLWLTAEIDALQEPTEEHRPSYAERVEDVIQLITDTHATDSWKDNGGSVGAITEISGSLIVVQLDSVHARIRSLLEKLERSAGERLALLIELENNE